MKLLSLTKTYWKGETTKELKEKKLLSTMTTNDVNLGKIMVGGLKL